MVAEAYEQLAGTPVRDRDASTSRRGAGAACATALAEARAVDVRRGVSTVGPHRDELQLSINGLPSRTHASQGEQRSLALALRLAGHRLVTERTGTAPVLVLDDVLSELDDHRATALLEHLPAGPDRHHHRDGDPDDRLAWIARCDVALTGMRHALRSVDRPRIRRRVDRSRLSAVKDPVPITTSIDSIMSSLRGTDRVQIGGVFGRWADAVGENVADHVRPVRLDQRVLTVEVDEAAWATQVKFLSATIIRRLHEVAGVEHRARRGPGRRLEGPGQPPLTWGDAPVATARSGGRSPGIEISSLHRRVLPGSETPRW